MMGGRGRLSRTVGVGEADEAWFDSSDSEPRRVGFIVDRVGVGSVYTYMEIE